MLDRKTFLLGLPLAAAALRATADAANESAQVTSDEALATLLAGNARYVQGRLQCDVQAERRTAMTGGQTPIAAVLSCSDSRVPVEHIFDQPPGNVFVVRVAGNVATTETIASIEYAVHVLKTPLVLVMGHESCGAVMAAIQYKKHGTTLPGQLQSLVKAIAPAITGTDLRAATDANVKNAARTLDRSELIHGAKIVGAYFSIERARVTVLS